MRRAAIGRALAARPLHPKLVFPLQYVLGIHAHTHLPIVRYGFIFGESGVVEGKGEGRKAMGERGGGEPPYLQESCPVEK